MMTAGEKNGLLKPFVYKMMILPRQARDKHRENSKKDHDDGSCYYTDTENFMIYGAEIINAHLFSTIILNY